MRIYIKEISKRNNIIDYIILFVTIFYIVFSPTSIKILPLTGILLIILNVYMIIKVRENSLLLLLIGFIAFVNISLGYTDCIQLGKTVSEWQLSALRSSSINIISAKSILLSMAIFNIFLDNTLIEFDKIKLGDIESTRKNNSIISYGGVFVLIFIIMYAFFTVGLRNNGTYVSVSSSIFEYSWIVVCFTWYYSKNKFFPKFIMITYFVMYTYIFVNAGDRSSIIIMLFLIAILFFYKFINIKNMVAIILIGVPFMNVIGIVRDLTAFKIADVISKVYERGLYVDTVSYAYYGGLAVASLYERVQNKVAMIFGFWGRCLGIDSEFGSLPEYATKNFPDLLNNGGGIYANYFYAFGGYIGVTIGSLLLGIIVHIILKNRNESFFPYKILLVIFVARWYLYSPMTLFRGVFVLGTLVLILCRIIYLFSTKIISKFNI